VADGPLFAVLELDETVSDRETAFALNRALNLEAGKELLSESSQWVLLNDFDKIVRVPLDQYGDRLEVYDPRNDGFAGRLRSFFVRNGKRYFFIPLEDSIPSFGGVLRPALFRSEGNKIRESMGDTPYKLTFPGEGFLRPGTAGPSGRGRSLYLVCYLLAAGLFCFLFRPRLLAFHLVWPLAGLSLLGSPGFAMGAILCLLAGLFLEPVREFCFSLRPAGSFRKGGGVFARVRRNGLVPCRSCRLLGIPLAGIYILSAILGRAGFLLGAGSFAAFFGVFFAYFMAELGGRGGHVLFVPVAIMEDRLGPGFPKSMLPFACASLVSALFSLSSFDFTPPPALAWLDETSRPVRLPDTGLSVENRRKGEIWPPLISVAEYEAHVQFQTGFSLLPLGGEFAEPEYFHYDIGQDGLITSVSAEPYGMEEAIPPFLLEGFMTFLENQIYTKADLDKGGLSLAGFFPVFCALVICIPAFTGPVRRGGGKRKPSLYNDKRIAA
jgi:hypothetical protein